MVIPAGPKVDAPVVLSKTWKPLLTIWTYWVRPISPSVSGGAQLQATPGNRMPSKLRTVPGMTLGITRPRSFPKLLWITGSGPSMCVLGSLGFSFASFSSSCGCTGCNFMSRNAGDSSFLTDQPTIMPDVLSWPADTAGAKPDAPVKSSMPKML